MRLTMRESMARGPFVVTLVLCWLLSHAGFAAAADVKNRSQTKPALPRDGGSTAKLAQLRKELIDKIRASRDALKRLVADHEKRLARQSVDYDVKRRAFERGLIARAELDKSGNAVSATRQELERTRRWIAEDDAALAFPAASERKPRASNVERTQGRSIVTRAFIRYLGSTVWSLADVDKIQTFFSDHFGRPLPVSAMGQSETHERMGLDHSEAVDVAVRPDSAEGRGLMAYLRRSGIPFIAFKSRVAGMATGPHIHIGPPSTRLVHAKPMDGPPPVADEAVGG
jgi:hypothetical protein